MTELPGGQASRFDKFTERSRRALTIAQERAVQFNAPTLGPNHLLLGLIDEGEGLAAKVLQRLGVDLDGLKAQVLAKEQSEAAKVTLSKTAKTVLQLAVEEARKMGHHYVGTEHLLLGLVVYAENEHLPFFEGSGITSRKVQKEIRAFFGQLP